MKIDENWLVKNNVCDDGIKWFSSQEETDAVAVVRALLRENKLDLANWTIAHLLDRKQEIQYVVFASSCYAARKDSDSSWAAWAAVAAVASGSAWAAVAAGSVDASSKDYISAVAAWVAWAAVAVVSGVSAVVVSRNDYIRAGTSMKKIIEYGISLLEKNP